MGKTGLDLLNKLKAGQKATVEAIKNENVNARLKKDNIDLITWFVVNIP
jgi:hypothetical protein